MANLLKISDNGTTIDFLDSSGTYRVTNWIPAVASRRLGELNHGQPFEDVVEEMTIDIRGSNPAASLRTLQRLMDRALRWSRGAPTYIHKPGWAYPDADSLVAAVYLQFTPDGSSISVAAAITGPPGPGEPMVELPPGFMLSPATKHIEGVVLRFKRRGLWMRQAVQNTGTTDAGASGTPLTLNFGVTPAAESPYTLEIDAPTNIRDMDNSYILVSEQYGLARFQAEELTATGFTSVADGNLSEDTNVLRYTPTSTNVATSGDESVVIAGNRFAVFVSYRNNGTRSYRVRAAAKRHSFFPTDENYTTPWFNVAAGASTPQWALLGTLTLSDPLWVGSTAAHFLLQVEASATGSSIDFDAVVVLGLDSPAAAVIAVGEFNAYSGGGTRNIVIDHRLMTHLSPAMYWSQESGGTEERIPYPASGRLSLTTDRNPITVMFLATGGSAATNWRRSESGGSLMTRTFTGRLSAGYVIPE